MASKQRIIVTGTFDIECAGWDSFVVGVTYRPIDGPEVWYDPDAMIDHMESVGGTWWAWGGGRYDALLVADRIYRRRKKLVANRAGGSTTRIVSGRLTIRDAMALVPMSLDRAASLAGLSAPRDLGWPCVCGDACGGYCSIGPRASLTPVQLAELSAYCAHDAQVAYAALAAVVTQFAADGFAVRGTIGGTAWETAKSWGGLPDAVRDPTGPDWYIRHWYRVARAYYGGRCIVARPRVRSPDESSPALISHWDMASAYPAALARTALPQGRPVELDGRRATKALAAECDGVYLARVVVPECYLPPLPVRTPDGGTAYPIGPIAGWWTLPELQAAIARGIKVVSVLEALVFPDDSRVMFAEVVSRWYQLRVAAGKDTAWGDLYRLVMNSVTGKLGQSPEHESIVFHPTKWKYCEPGSPHSRKGGCTSRECTGRCLSYRSMRDDQSIASVPFLRIDSSSHVHWAAYLTAATRIAWLTAAESVGADLVYGATDSIWSLGRAPTPQGDRLGDWGLKEAPWHEFTSPRPGAYAVRRLDGSSTVRASGMPDLSWDQWSDLTVQDPRERRRLGLTGTERGTVTVERGVMSLAEAAGAGTLCTVHGRVCPPGCTSPRDGSLFRRTYRVTRMSESDGWYGDRKLAPGDGRTYPVTYGQSQEQRSRRGRSTRPR